MIFPTFWDFVQTAIGICMIGFAFIVVAWGIATVTDKRIKSVRILDEEPMQYLLIVPGAFLSVRHITVPKLSPSPAPKPVIPASIPAPSNQALNDALYILKRSTEAHQRGEITADRILGVDKFTDLKRERWTAATDWLAANGYIIKAPTQGTFVAAGYTRTDQVRADVITSRLPPRPTPNGDTVQINT